MLVAIGSDNLKGLSLEDVIKFIKKGNCGATPAMIFGIDSPKKKFKFILYVDVPIKMIQKIKLRISQKTIEQQNLYNNILPKLGKFISEKAQDMTIEEILEKIIAGEYGSYPILAFFIDKQTNKTYPHVLGEISKKSAKKIGLTNIATKTLPDTRKF
jgi:predicted transcriptional regulator